MPKKPDTHETRPKEQAQAKTGTARNDARQSDGSFQPHNAKKEGLGPNTKR